jgi:hypothetical protein
MNQDVAVAEVLAKRTVSLDVAAAALTMGRNKAHRLARERGRLVDGVPVVRMGDWGYVVPTPALRRVLQLQDFTVGSSPAEVPPAVKTTEGGPRLGPPSVTAQMSDRLKEGAPSDQGNRFDS